MQGAAEDMGKTAGAVYDKYKAMRQTKEQRQEITETLHLMLAPTVDRFGFLQDLFMLDPQLTALRIMRATLLQLFQVLVYPDQWLVLQKPLQ